MVMKGCLKMELHRLFRAKSLWVALFIAFCFVASHILQIVLPYAQENVALDSLRYHSFHFPFSACMFFMGYDMYGWQGEILYRLMPLLAAIPFANSYFCDISEGYIKNLQGKCRKEHYLIAKYAVTFLSGGLVMSVPFILDMLCCMALLPTHQPVPIGVFEISLSYSALYYDHTILFILLYLFVDFLIGGLYAVTVFLGTEFIANKYLLVVFPYICVMIWQLLLQMLQISGLDPVELSNPAYESATVFRCLCLFLVWFGITFFVFFIRGRRRDEVV